MSKNTKNFEFRLGRPGFVCFLLGMTALLFVFFLLGLRMGVDLDANPERLASWPAAAVRHLGLTSDPLRELKEKTGPSEVEIKSPEADQAGIEDAAETDAKSGQETLNEATAKVDALPEGVTVGKLKEAPQNGQLVREAPRGSEVSTGPVVADKKEVKNSESRRTEKFTIRVAAFREVEKAEKLRVQIAALGYRAVLRKVENAKSGARFRVELRDIETKEEAEKILARLSKQFKGLRGVIRSEGVGGN